MTTTNMETPVVVRPEGITVPVDDLQEIDCESVYEHGNLVDLFRKIPRQSFVNHLVMSYAPN